MSKPKVETEVSPRELYLRPRFNGELFAGYDLVDGDITMDDVDFVYHVREVLAHESYKLDKPEGAPKAAESVESVMKRANGLLRSAYQVAAREGKTTNWSAFRDRVHEVLADWPASLMELAVTETTDSNFPENVNYVRNMEAYNLHLQEILKHRSERIAELEAEIARLKQSEGK